MKYLTFVFLLFSSLTFAQDQNEITISSDVYDEILKHLTNCQTIEEGLPKIELESIKVTIDKDGRVFVPAQVVGKMSLGYLNFELKVDTKTEVFRQIEKEKWFKLRYKVGGYVDFASLSSDTRFGGNFLVEPLHIGLFGLNGSIGSTFAGGGVSADITKNLSMVGLVGMTYSDASLAVGVGAAFSLN